MAGRRASESIWRRTRRALLRTRAGQALRILLKGTPRREAQPSAPAGRRRRTGPLDEPRLPRRSLPAPDPWPDVPALPDDLALSWKPPQMPRDRDRFNIELFEKLNEEYRQNPIVVARRTDAPGRFEAARGRLSSVREFVQIEGTALEIGCGTGQEVWLLRHKFGCRASGVDLVPNRGWLQYRGDGVSYSVADAASLPFAGDCFERILSFAVWEHLPHPYRALEEARRILRPGGIFWLYANLHRGASASHRYREVFFPWPHLLFDEDVIDEFYARRGLPQIGFSWVNRLTYDTYAKYFKLLGFEVLHTKWTERWDQEFYERFSDVLSRYPVTDLRRDFFVAALRKPAPGEDVSDRA